MDEPDPPTAATPPPPPSRLQRTLNSLRAPFRAGSPFHIGATIKRSASTKSSASDGELGPRARIMRKKNKKQKREAAASGAGASRSSEGSPAADPARKEGFVRRLSSIGRRKGEGAPAAASPVPATPHDEPSSERDTPTPPALASPPAPPPPPPPVPIARESGGESVSAAVVSDVAVEHPVATRPFTKAAWTRRAAEMERPVEEPSPGDAVRRRIAFVSHASEERAGDGAGAEGGGAERGVGSLEEAVALARARLSHSPSPGPRADALCVGVDDESCADDMPPYGDLLEPAAAAAATASPPSSSSTSGGERREHLYKILVIGELGTGKTSIIKRYVHQFFSQHYRATIGVDFALKVLNWDANTIIRLQLWDIAGQERFGNMTRVYYKEAVGAFVVFDVTRVATFDAVVKWKNDLDAKVQLPDGSPIPCVLLANKCDQQKEGIVNSPAKMEEYCREKGFARWFETSAKENINIEEAARSLVNKILLNDKLLQSNDSKDNDKFALDHKIANGENGRSGGGKSCAC